MISLVKGIDVSKHQGTIEWEKVKQSGVDFAMLRAGYGRYENQKDETFEINYNKAKQAGIKVGTYHYCYAKTIEDAKTEANTFLKWIESKTFEYPVALDIEEDYQSEKGKQFVSDVIRAFCEIVEKAGYYVCVYANKYWFDNFIDDDCKNKYDVWVAQWSDNNTYNGNYGMWQYTSDGVIEGISGRVDMNYSYKDYYDIMTSNNLNGFTIQQVNSENKVYQNVKDEFPAKMMVSLYNVPLFASSTAEAPSATKTGTYYIYDGVEVNGRYRITNTPERALKKPISENVTGFINKSDLK